jgi:hypothetical protein
MRSRRTVTPFNLSFLDIMFCGFGAVVLLVLILNRETVQQRQQTSADLRSEVSRLERAVVAAEQGLVVARNDLEQTEQELLETRGRADQVIRVEQQTRQELARMDQQTLARRESVEQLKSDLKSLDRSNERLGARVKGDQGKGNRVRKFLGDGERQYLTGLKVGGKRIVILIDVSASMLDETLVNIIRLRNMDDASKRQSAKWQRALAVVEWLVANFPRESLYQIIAFNTKAGSVLPASAGQWLNASDSKTLDRAVTALGRRIPAGGTSLQRAFEAAAKLSPRPDNILLITDGLPTQGRRKPTRSTVSAEQRLRHFKNAEDALPGGVPVNTILLPLEGDAYAAFAFWELAVSTKGSFGTPSRDWP